MVWLQLVICVIIILFLGRRVARYGDIIANKTGLGGLWVGLVLLSVTTSLPELFTGVSAIVIVDAPDLTIGNLLGANTFNLLNLALLDTTCRNQCIVNMASSGQRPTVWFSLVLIAVAGLAILLQPVFNFTLGWLGWATPVIIVLYLIFIRQIFLYEKRNPHPEITEEKYEDASLKKTAVYFAISALFIIGAGIWLAMIGDEIAVTTGLGQNFVGSLLIGLTTTLPEITVSYSALRLGAVDLAVSNMIGSNMFNIFLICIDDLMFTRGAILGAVSPNNLITVTTVILMTLITLAALYFKPRRFFHFSWYNILMVLTFVAGALITYILS